MLKSKSFYKTIFIVILVLLPWVVNRTSLNEEITILNRDSVSFYQKNSCEISLYDFLSNNKLRESLRFRFDSYSEISCFGKIQYIEPTSNNYVIFIGNHFLINLLIQATVWLILITYIKPNKSNNDNKVFINSVFTTILFYLHFISENSYYSQKNIYYSTSFSFHNYLLASYVLTVFLICYFIGKICFKRLDKLIFYFPFLFLINGVISNSNINFFSLLLVFYGFENLKSINKLFKFNILYLIFLPIWLNKSSKTFDYFDVDKLIGFSPTNNSKTSLLFWFLTILLIINGLFYLVDKVQIFNHELVFNNYLISGVLIVLVGVLASINQVTNFLAYFTFGQNKFSSLSLESIAGNAWRGFAPSAEMIGEFYAVIYLMFFLLVINLKLKPNVVHYVCLIIISYGLFRANNAAALISFLAIIIYLLVNKYLKKFNFSIFILLTLFASIVFYFSLRQNSYSIMGQSIVYEGLSLTNESLQNESLYIEIQNLIDANNYLDAISKLDSTNKISSSLKILTYNLTNQNNIHFAPNFVALFGTIALLINRSEKWGIFFAKYDPSFQDFIFGYGPLNLVEYNFNNILIDGLVLPHSSLLSLLIFIGLIGVLIFILFLISSYKISIKNNFLHRYLLIFLSINYLKSDSMLYFSSLIMFLIFILFSFKTSIKN